MTNTTHYVVITGAAKGLGLAIAKQAIHNGYYVIGIGRNVSEEFINISENQQTFIEFDFNNLVNIPDLVLEIMDVVGEGVPYGLVNNAATGLDGLLATQHLTDISKVLTINLHAPIILTKYFSRRMIKFRRGRIINIIYHVRKDDLF